MLKEEIQAIFMAEYGFKPTKKSIYTVITIYFALTTGVMIQPRLYLINVK